MKLTEIKEVAKQRGIAAGRMKKRDLVRTIQKSEGSIECYYTGRSGICGQAACLWRNDCR
jgi:hypothetical protein